MMKRSAILAVAVALPWSLGGCDERPPQVSLAVPNGDPARGALAIRRYGCGACHTIPGIPGANATVGPPLAHFARNAYVAGVMPNLPDRLVAWIVDPPAIAPRTAMPDLDVNEADARDIAAYIYGTGR